LIFHENFIFLKLSFIENHKLRENSKFNGEALIFLARSIGNIFPIGRQTMHKISRILEFICLGFAFFAQSFQTKICENRPSHAWHFHWADNHETGLDDFSKEFANFDILGSFDLAFS